MSGLRVAARMKPVIVVKAGRQAEGSRAAVTHSGALVGADDVFDAALQRAGAVRATTIQQLFAAATLLLIVAGGLVTSTGSGLAVPDWPLSYGTFFPAMVGGILAALFFGKNDPGFVHNGPLAGLVAVCAGSDIMHPMGALVVGAVAGALFVFTFTLAQNKWRIDDVLGVWPLHGLCGVWGGIAAGIFGLEALGGLGGVSLTSQLIGTGLGVGIAFVGGLAVYGGLKAVVGIKLDQEEEYNGADLTIHKIYATQGIEVPDHILREAVAALKEERFVYKPPPDTLATRLARLYVSRERWGKWLLGAFAGLLLAAVGYIYFMVFQPWAERTILG